MAPISQKFLVAPKKNTTGKSGHFKPNLAEVDGKISIEPVIRQAKIFIQIGAYTKFQNARKVRAILKQLGTVKITQIDKDRQPYFRVRIGPLSEVTAADQILAQVVQAGYKKATTGVE